MTTAAESIMAERTARRASMTATELAAEDARNQERSEHDRLNREHLAAEHTARVERWQAEHRRIDERNGVVCSECGAKLPSSVFCPMSNEGEGPHRF